MGFGILIPKQIEILKEFRKYERTLYTYFFDSEKKIEDIAFYFIPTEYIIKFCKDFKYSQNSEELDQLIVYTEAEKNSCNKTIIDLILDNLKYRINIRKDFEKIINDNLIMKELNNSYVLKFSKDGSFIPLTAEFWNLFTNHCEYDKLITKKGFVNNGEIFIPTEEENKIDCFFTLYKTKDLIYHYCFIMDTPDFDTVVSYFKWEGHKYTARYLISISGIEIDRVKQYKKSKKKIPKHVSNIEGYDITIYFVDSFKFHDSEDKNFLYFKNNNEKLYNFYSEYSNKINNSINGFLNTNH